MYVCNEKITAQDLSVIFQNQKSHSKASVLYLMLNVAISNMTNIIDNILSLKLL